STKLPSILAPWAGGWLSAHRPPQFTFFVAAVLALAVTFVSFWQPKQVYTIAHGDTVPTLNIRSLRALKELMRHPALYLPALIMFLWNFSPGWNTPILFYMTNTVKLTQEQYGGFGSIINITMFLVTGAYLLLCRRFRLIYLLWLGT